MVAMTFSNPLAQVLTERRMYSARFEAYPCNLALRASISTWEEKGRPLSRDSICGPLHGQRLRKFLQIMGHRGDGKGEKEDSRAYDHQQQKKDRKTPSRGALADFQPHDAMNHGHEDHGEERRHIDQQQDLAHVVGDEER